MTTKLSDKKRKALIAEYAEGGTSVRKLAEKYGVSPATVQRIINADDGMADLVEEKRQENTKNILAHLNERAQTACELIDILQEAMYDPSKLEKATLPQIATAMAILIDKYTMAQDRLSPNADLALFKSALEGAPKIGEERQP